MERLLSRLLALIEQRLSTLRPNSRNQYQRECLKEAASALARILSEMKRPGHDRARVNAEIVRVLILAAEGGIYGARGGT